MLAIRCDIPACLELEELKAAVDLADDSLTSLLDANDGRYYGTSNGGFSATTTQGSDYDRLIEEFPPSARP